ncbi:DUF4436 domain-containing protein [Skermania sp. ID1734]|uniref:DUF4436 family protein n=1 Tax=Skermania sp. ID1734 TaxID=2597516 RepID=UPI00117C949B|nr:DUF4436 family protein [Skermania sp. ID1734]TSD94076.1 DUF4436 domain-containing protein [Skermania sp. ID1734]
MTPEQPVTTGAAEVAGAAGGRRSHSWAPVSVLVLVVTVIALTYVATILAYWSMPGTGIIYQDSVAGSSARAHVDLERIDEVNNKITARIWLSGARSFTDPMTGRLTGDIEILFYPALDAGPVLLHQGHLPTQSAETTLPVSGDHLVWPFDHYASGALIAAVRPMGANPGPPLRVGVEVFDELHGWDVHTGDVQRPTPALAAPGLVVERSFGALIFAILLTAMIAVLPVLGLFVAVQTARSRRIFYPPMTTWFAALLFAIIPLRTVLPGAPEPGAWIDVTVVLWAIVGLVTAMVIYVYAWWSAP